MVHLFSTVLAVQTGVPRFDPQNLCEKTGCSDMFLGSQQGRCRERWILWALLTTQPSLFREFQVKTERLYLKKKKKDK